MMSMKQAWLNTMILLNKDLHSNKKDGGKISAQQRIGGNLINNS